MKLTISLLFFVFLSTLYPVPPATADLVYGHVYDENGKSILNKPLLFRELQDYNKNGKMDDYRTTSDANGNYSILLPPGFYRVECEGKEAYIQSHPQPLRQDIRLRKKQG